MNSWDKTIQLIENKYYQGQVEMLKSTSRSSSYDISDSSISQTAGGETADFTSLAGTDVLCVVVLINCMLTGSATWGILKYREVGDTGDNDGDEQIGFRQAAYGGSGSGTRLSQMHILPARGTDPGKFEYWTTAGQTVDDGLVMMYYGRIMR
tara:strand:- start:1632 stop:2087 length:456 start_codon:yes stop_codon:yes gene_type:complete